MSKKADMPFMGHLEALRKNIIRSVVAVVVCSIVAGAFINYLVDYVILGPSDPEFITFQWMCELGNLWDSSVLCIDEIPIDFQNRKPFGQIAALFTISIAFGFIAAFPFVFYQFWSFIRPALYPREKRHASGMIFFVTLLFLIGVAFAYFIILPLAVNFFSKFKLHESWENIFDITSFVSFELMLILSSGLMFQLPIAVYFLSKIGIVTPKLMRKYRKHAVVIILIIAAIITPPDVITQIGIGIPIFFLYELSILISFVVNRKRNKRLKE